MAKATFTARWVAAVKSSTETQADYFDTKPPALGLRLAPSGRKTWFIIKIVLGNCLLQRAEEKEVGLKGQQF
jgi:hypothetical protein